MALSSNELKILLTMKDNASQGMRAFGSNVTRVMGLVVGAAGIGGAIKSAADLQKSMAEVSTLLKDTSGIDGMTASVRAMAVEFGSNAPDQAKALYQIISAGAASGKESIDLLTASNKLALGGVTDITTAADGLTSALNSYGDQAGGAAHVSDLLFTAMKDGKTTVGELSGFLGNVAPIASQAGVGLDELLASVSALTKGGVDTSRAVDGMRGVIAAVIKPSGEAQKMAKKLGIEFSAAGLKSKGLAGFLQDVADKTGGSTEQMAQLFGGVEALVPVLALTGKQAGDFANIVDDMKTSAGATDEAVKKMSGTFNYQFKQSIAKAKDLGLTIGNKLLPSVTQLITFLNDNAAPALDAIGTAFDGLKLIFKGVAEGFLFVASKIIGGLRHITEAAAIVTGVLGLDMADGLHASAKAFHSIQKNIDASIVSMMMSTHTTKKSSTEISNSSAVVKGHASAIQQSTEAETSNTGAANSNTDSHRKNSAEISNSSAVVKGHASAIKKDTSALISNTDAAIANATVSKRYSPELQKGTISVISRTSATAESSKATVDASNNIQRATSMLHQNTSALASNAGAARGAASAQTAYSEAARGSSSLNDILSSIKSTAKSQGLAAAQAIVDQVISATRKNRETAFLTGGYARGSGGEVPSALKNLMAQLTDNANRSALASAGINVSVTTPNSQVENIIATSIRNKSGEIWQALLASGFDPSMRVVV